MLQRVTQSHPPIDAERLRQLEAEVGHPLPQPYQQFLLQYNGGELEPRRFSTQWNDPALQTRFSPAAVRALYGIDDDDEHDLSTNFFRYRERIPAGTMPIGQDPGGNLLLLGLSPPHTGRVLFWVQDQEVAWEDGETPDFSNVGFVAQTFFEFLDALDDA